MIAYTSSMRQTLILNFLTLAVSAFLLPIGVYAQSTAASTGKIIVNVRSQVREDNIKDGVNYLLDLINAAYPPPHYQVNFKACPWKRCIKDVMTGEADIILGIYDNEVFLGEKIATNRYPVFISEIGVAFLQNLTPNWQGINSIMHRSAAMIRGYDLHREIDVPLKIIEVSDFEQEWKLLISGRVDFILDGMNALSSLQKSYANASHPVRIEPIFNKYSYLGFSTQTKSQALAQLFDSTMLKLYDSGEIKHLQNKWNIKNIPDHKVLLQKSLTTD